MRRTHWLYVCNVNCRKVKLFKFKRHLPSSSYSTVNKFCIHKNFARIFVSTFSCRQKLKATQMPTSKEIINCFTTVKYHPRIKLFIFPSVYKIRWGKQNAKIIYIMWFLTAVTEALVNESVSVYDFMNMESGVKSCILPYCWGEWAEWRWQRYQW